jgi:hypothetical protein
LQVPSFVKICMVAAFHKTGFQVEVADIVIGRSKSEEDASEIVEMKLSAPVTTMLDTHPRAEHFQMGEIGFCAEITFKRSDFGFGMDQTIVEVD